MRRIILMAIASSALALAAPQAASAHHGHHRHHAKHHARKARLRHFGVLAGAPATGPGTPTSPTPAGTVKSFTEGVLTITLGDGSTIAGKVTEDTDIRCFKPGSTEGDDDQGDDDQGDDDNRAVAADHGSWGDSEHEHGDDDGGAGSCTTAALVEKAVVLGAELRVGPSGAVWKHIILAA